MKILVNLSVPVIPFHSDLFIPSSMKIRDLINLISNSAQEASSKFFPCTGREVICHLESGTVLNKEDAVESSGVKNGHHLILI